MDGGFTWLNKVFRSDKFWPWSSPRPMTTGAELFKRRNSVGAWANSATWAWNFMAAVNSDHLEHSVELKRMNNREGGVGTVNLHEFTVVLHDDMTIVGHHRSWVIDNHKSYWEALNALQKWILETNGPHILCKELPYCGFSIKIHALSYSFDSLSSLWPTQLIFDEQH
jgi:hypothetical protein